MTTEHRLYKLSEPEPNSGCWLWLGSVTNQGYGKIMMGKVQRRAHRVSFETFKGPIHDELHVLHKCDVTSCINPDHLFLGTRSDNMQDMYAKNRHRRLKFNGSDHGMAKLTEQQVLEIRASKPYTPGLSKKYGVSNSRISAIRNGTSWSYLNEQVRTKRQ